MAGRAEMSGRIGNLRRAYKVVEKMNRTYREAEDEKRKYEIKRDFASSIRSSCLDLGQIISEGEKAWRRGVLLQIEEEIEEALGFIYPNDAYQVKLEPRVVRGKVHIDTFVKSNSFDSVSGSMKRTQGLLFRQIISIASVMRIMKMRGVNVVYIDEAFSGASKENLIKVHKLLKWYQEKGANMVIIMQDPTIISGLDAHMLVLSRSWNNKTEVRVID